MITQSERENWFRDEVTQEFLRKLRSSREDTKENWATQKYVTSDPAETTRLNLYALAGIEILDQVIDLAEENRPDAKKGED